jgi:uncharacterized protein YciI
MSNEKEPAMKFVVLFEDEPSAGPDARRAHTAAHLAFLERHADKVEAAGPLLSADGRGAGGLWIVDAPDPQAVDRLVKSDPFWPTGLRKAVRILRWTQVFAGGQLVAQP